MTAISPPQRRRPPVAMLVAVAAAWSAMLGAELTGRADLLYHDTLIEGDWPLGLALIVFVLAWVLMVVAMMLPSALSMIRLHARAVAAHPRPRWSRAAFLGGYATVWVLFGALAFLGDAGVHATVDASPWLTDHEWVVGGTLLLLAGAAQFLPLTQACLKSCRHPYGFLMTKFRPGVSASYELGSDHGLYCLGCCWGLMLVMFAVGVAAIAWMAVLTGVMAYEKTGRYGAQLSRIVGVGLLVWGAIVMIHSPLVPTSITNGVS